jgi:biotin transporter BioY
MLRWMLALAVAAWLTERFDALGEGARGLGRVFVYLAAARATFLVCGICVLLIAAHVYLYLTRHER